MLFILILVIISCTHFATGQEVQEYTNENFDANLKLHDTMLVMFYAPWCGHCQKLKTSFEEASKKLYLNKPKVVLGKVDCTGDAKELCDKYNVARYPSIKIFQNGKFVKDYEDPRNALAIVKYMKYYVAPSYVELKNETDLNEFLNARQQTTIVGYFEHESELKDIFVDVASELKGKMNFAYTHVESLMESSGVKNGIILYKPIYLKSNLEEDYVLYDKDWNKTKIIEFINQNQHGLVGYRTRINKKEFKTPLVIAYYEIDFVRNMKGTHYWRNRILKVAKNYKDKFNFAISNRKDFQKELKEFEIASQKSPVIIARDEVGKKYIMEENFSVENFEDFMKGLVEKRLKPVLKSEPIPEQEYGLVHVAVAKNFDEVVTNNGEDTMIKFYAPWCAHCQRLKPIYEKLAKKLEHEDVVFVEMDATENDVFLPYKVDSYPKIYWVGKDAKDKPLVYDGKLNSDSLFKFVAKHATNELKKFDRNGSVKLNEEL